VIVPVMMAALLDAALLALVGVRLWRSRHRGASLRMRLFGALAAAVLVGALATGVYSVAVDSSSIGFAARLVSVAPKAFVLASALLVVAAAAAALAGRHLARSVEQLADAASRIAEGDRAVRIPSADDDDARRIARALATLRREVADRPYASAFLRDAWHDLKTPLAAIRANVELLQDGAMDDPPAARRFVGHVARASADLDRMLADLVTLARMETASLARERATPLQELVGDTLDRLAPLATARSVSVDADLAPGTGAHRSLRCDPAALSRALGNLLENAIQASPGGRVRLSAFDAGSDMVALDVVNEPASVPRDMRAALFERANTAGAHRGSGLGLAIARAAIEAHGGRVRFVEMGPPRVRVRVELPC
jgi:signal transduction histidine kinase